MATMIRLVLIGALVVGLLGATAIVGADTNDTASADAESGIMGPMGEQVPGDCHDGVHDEHHDEHHHGDHDEHHDEHHHGDHDEHHGSGHC